MRLQRSRAQLACILGCMLLATPLQHCYAQTKVPGAPAAPARTFTGTSGNLIVGNGQNTVIDVAHSAAYSGRAGLVNIPGDLRVQAGSTLYAVSTNPAVQNAVIRASNIFNSTNGSITSILPVGGLSGFSTANTNLSLSLIALHSLINHGTISSANQLNLYAGQELINKSLEPSIATLQAANGLNLFARNIVNSGVIASLNGNVTVNNPVQYASTIKDITQVGKLSSLIGDSSTITNSGLIVSHHGSIDIGSVSNLTINANGGTFKAPNGEINVGDPGSNAKLLMNGGDYISNALNLRAGDGTITANLGMVTGTINTVAAASHILADTSNLQIGETCVSGDPLYYNTGDVTVGGNISVAEKLTIIAGGNIKSTSALNSILARDTNGQGYDITFIAGANVSPTCGSCSSDASLGTESTTAVSISPTSPNGGDIDFSASPNLVIDASSNSGNRNGGNVLFAAFAKSFTGGHIYLPETSSVKSSGDGTGNNGNVSLIAGNTASTISVVGGVAVAINAITLGTVIADGGTGNSTNTGQLLVISGQPTSSDGKPLVFGIDGGITSNNTIIPGPIQAVTNSFATAILLAGNLSSLGIDAQGPGSITLTGNASSSGSVFIASSSSTNAINVVGPLSGTTVTISGGGNINLTNSITSSGNLSVTAGTGIDIRNASIASLTSSGGAINLHAGTGSIGFNGATVTLSAAGSVSVLATNIDVTQLTNPGGNISISSGSIVTTNNLGQVATASPAAVILIPTLPSPKPAAVSVADTVRVSPPINTPINTPIVTPISELHVTGALAPTDVTRNDASFIASNQLDDFDASHHENSPNNPTSLLNVQIYSAVNDIDSWVAQANGNGGAITRGGSDHELTLHNGIIMFAPTSDMVVNTKAGSVFIARGAKVLIAAHGNELAVCDISDEGNGDVTVTAGDNVLALLPGQQLVLSSNSNQDFESMNPLSQVAHRNERSLQVGDNRSGYLCEFSVASLLADTNLYHQLKSANSASVFNNILKSAAALQVTTAHYGLYHRSSQHN